MDLALLSSHNIIGMYYARLENPALNWMDGVSNLFGSDLAMESYPFLGQNPRMREWIGGRQAKGLRGNIMSIINKHYEATMEFALRDLRRDKTPQIQARISEFADEGQAHWGTLLSALIAAGTGGTLGLCYDGQYFFDTDHTEGENQTSQSNSISSDISTLPALVHGSTTAPSVEEMQQSILAGIVAIMSFKDDQKRPMNTNGKRFLVLVPIGLYIVAVAACSTLATAALQQNLNPNIVAGLTVDVQMDAESALTAGFYVFRTDSPIKALIRQNETDPQFKLKDEQSEFAFDNDAIQIGIDAWRAVGYGYWQRACLVTMT